MGDILTKIVTEREEDYLRLGPSFGVRVPENRSRPLIQFLKDPGLVLEIKRASPSKGDIAPNLDPIELGQKYRRSGAQGISILTENRYFKGSLEDLLQVGQSIGDVALLRKDFLTHLDEIDISYRSGADAVLLIARILSKKQVRKMARRCRELGMTPFIEIRDEEDSDKLQSVLQDGYAIAGVNSRDLTSFTVDPLIPAAMRDSIPCKAIYESGADSAGACVYARSLGFDGMLIGESVAREPDLASIFTRAFTAATPNKTGQFWKEVAKRRDSQRAPLVKICGITNIRDAEIATSQGSSLLGFICADSPRSVDESSIRSIVKSIRKVTRPPLMVGVITELESDTAHQAIRLVKEGVLDALQCHGQQALLMIQTLDKNFSDTGIGRFAAIGIADEDDFVILETLLRNGEPRVLCDTKVPGKSGGSGTMMSKTLLNRVSQYGHPWIAGGIGPDNVRSVVTLHAELIDASSRLEASIGIKDPQLLEHYFKEVFGEH